jgi:adenosylcobyric acid synthase
MVQGTASGVGKSVIATALCRVLRDAGYRVAPFKAQNMSLNAAVTPAGEEIGRAQAAQAEAAGVAPRATMNPILLKPEGEGRSQIVVLGRSRGSLAARDYSTRRAELWPVVRDSLRELRREFDVIVIEGAGSPAEVNLRRTELANMRVALAADAAVLLVADIEPGGVFAQVLGTLALLRQRERALVRAVIVNKFRGDPALFASGVRFLRREAGIPVLGVLPYLEDMPVPPEDSLSLDGSPRDGALDAVVVRYPRISNFDDFGPLAEGGVRVRFVRRAQDVGVPDLVILPGTKATIADLEWMRATGIAARVLALADAGVPLLGICGGFQMLGRTLADPGGVEGSATHVRGLGLLPVRTVFVAEKRAVVVRGRVVQGGIFAGLAGAELTGYELHVGDTTREGARHFADLARAPGARRVRDGAVSPDGRVIGTYVHGLFASAAVREAIVARLAARRGIAFAPRTLAADRYAALAEWFRTAVDTRRLMRVAGLGRGG